MKTGSILIDFDVIFSMQLSEFIKSLNFGSNFIKTARKEKKSFRFLPKTPMQQSEFKVSISVESYDEKTDEITML